MSSFGLIFVLCSWIIVLNVDKLGGFFVAALEELGIGIGLFDVEFDDDTDGWIKWDKMLL